jgi:hypothetical protein
MAVESFRELARTIEGEIGTNSVLTRRFVVTLSDDTLGGNPTDESTLLTALGLQTWGAAHPLSAGFQLRKVRLVEGYDGSPYHVEAIAEYTVLKPNDLLAPTARAAEWKFETVGGQEVAALSYYDGSTRRALTNSAYDFFQGLTVEESSVKATVTKNTEAFPSGVFAANNCVNSASYLGCDTHTLKVTGITTEKIYESYNNTNYAYWRWTASMTYRSTGWNLQLPDVGYNFISGGQKRRAMVFDFQNAEWVASPNPVGLDGSGGQTLGAPAILVRRIYPEANFSSLFGAVPT